MRNRFLAWFCVGHSGARLFFKVISRKVRADWSWRCPWKKHCQRARAVNSLGNHTVNNIHSFWVVFAGFDREDFISKDFAKIFRIRLALPHFSCIHFFYWKPILLGDIVDLLSKILLKTWREWEGNTQLNLYDHVLDDILDSKSKISLRRIDFQ